jgi:lysophospholipase L1-like esterase
MPVPSVVERPLIDILPLPEYYRPDSVFFSVALPEGFQDASADTFIDPRQTLYPLYERLFLMRTQMPWDSLSILHIGDSHVRGHYFPQAMGAAMRIDFGAVGYEDMGVNGATCLTFTHAQRIQAIREHRPALLIVSFGTNEAHNRRYSSAAHYQQIDELIRLLREACPDAPILLTTPPGAYERIRRNGRRVYTVNKRTEQAATTIRRYADEHGLACWDLYTLSGGSQAAVNWWNSGLMRLDHIHFLEAGYRLQGESLYQALINGYNTYITTHP